MFNKVRVISLILPPGISRKKYMPPRTPHTQPCMQHRPQQKLLSLLCSSETQSKPGYILYSTLQAKDIKNIVYYTGLQLFCSSEMILKRILSKMLHRFELNVYTCPNELKLNNLLCSCYETCIVLFTKPGCIKILKTCNIANIQWNPIPNQQPAHILQRSILFAKNMFKFAIIPLLNL